jgi:hypothetical protein
LAAAGASLTGSLAGCSTAGAAGASGADGASEVVGAGGVDVHADRITPKMINTDKMIDSFFCICSSPLLIVLIENSG